MEPAAVVGDFDHDAAGLVIRVQAQLAARGFAALCALLRRLDAVIVSPRDWDVAGSRAGYVDGRNDQAIAIVSRAVERGECAPGTDPVRVADLLGAGLCLPVLLYDRPINDADCEFVVGTVLNGIVAREGDHLG